MNRLKNLSWIENHLHEDIISEPMHDGIGYYWNEKLVLILIESSQTAVHRGVTYPFQIWNGCLFPVEKIKQNAAIRRFLFLENHPAMKDCLYLPAEDENFEELTREVLKEIFKGNPLFGKFVTLKKPSKKSKVKASKKLFHPSKPTLFLDDLDKIVGDDGSEDHSSKKAVAKKTSKIKSGKKNKTAKKAENLFILSKLR